MFPAQLTLCVPLDLLEKGGFPLFLVFVLDASCSLAAEGRYQTLQRGDAWSNMSFTGLSYLGAGELLPLRVAMAVSDSVTIVLNLEDGELQVFFCLLCLAALFSPTIFLVQSL